MLLSKLKEALICFKNLRVTLPYPFQPAPPPPGFRGRVDIDIDKCIGCSACAVACPPKLIDVKDLDGKRILEFQLGRCTYCARCAEVCPTAAIAMAPDFELATDNKADLNISVELNMVKCENCGAAFTTQRIMNKLATEVSKELGMEPADMKWLHLCPECRVASEVEKMIEAGS